MANEVRLIECRSCDCKNCNGCNLFTLAEMLHNRDFDCLMDEHKTIAFTPESLRPKGRWTENRRVGFSDAIEDDVCWFTYTCSECGGEVMNGYHYCPNCGADMRGEVDDK